MHQIYIYFICLGCLFSAALGAQEESAAPLSTLSESEILHFQMLVEGNNRFAFDLYQQEKNRLGNFYFSPYSIVTGLGMVMIGAKGETARQLQKLFRYSPALLLFIGDLNASLQKSSDNKNIAQVLLGNAIWFDKSVSLLPSFKQTLMRNFRIEPQIVDFMNELSQSVQKINNWTLQQIKGKIGNIILLQDISKDARMVLTTAAELKGQWAYPFHRQLTKQMPFQVTTQRTLLVSMMQNTSNYLNWRGEQWDIIVVPYIQGGEGAQLSMVILLPHKNVPLAELEKNLNFENWRQWKGMLQNQVVTLSLPQFRIERRLELDISLKGLGVNVIFNPEADFSGITNQKGIYLDHIFHKTAIRIDEKGANVVSGIQVRPLLSSEKEETSDEFIIDRPFAFMIWDQKTDSILFMGRLALP